MSIQFTQFLMPFGEQKKVLIDRPDEIEAMAVELVVAGHSFEIEMLRTSDISMTVEIEGPNGETISRGHQICDNGPEVSKYVDKLVNEAYANWQGHDELADRYGPAMRAGAED